MAQPRRIGNIVADLVARRGYGRIQAAATFADTWQEVAGAQLGKFSRAGVVKRGVLEVHVANSTMLQEMTFQKMALLKKLAAIAPDENIRDLRFRVGPVT